MEAHQDYKFIKCDHRGCNNRFPTAPGALPDVRDVRKLAPKFDWAIKLTEPSTDPGWYKGVVWTKDFCPKHKDDEAL